MTVFNIYKLNDNESGQLDLFFSKSDGTLDLRKVVERMKEFSSPVEKDGIIAGEGFLKIQEVTIGSKEMIEAYATGQGSLGYYTQAFVTDNEEVDSRRKQQQFFSRAKIFITGDNLLIIMFSDTTEEKIKSNIKNLVESVGFSVSNFQLSNNLMRKVRQNYQWKEVRLEKLDNEKDSTTKVYYEIDIADGENESLIDSIYSEHGSMVLISFEMPSDHLTNAPNFITVKLYKNDNRIVLESNEFPDTPTENKFIVYLTDELIEMVS